MAADISGWVVLYGETDSRLNVRFMHGCFAKNDEMTVPLMWNLADRWDLPDAIIGHAVLTEKEEGLYADCYLNEDNRAKSFREEIASNPPIAFTFFANKLQYAKRRRCKILQSGYIHIIGFEFNPKKVVLKSSKIEQINIKEMGIYGDKGTEGNVAAAAE